MFNWFKSKKTKYQKLWHSLKLVKQLKDAYALFEYYAGKEESEVFGAAYDKIKAVVKGNKKLNITHKTAYNLAYIIANVKSLEELKNFVKNGRSN